MGGGDLNLKKSWHPSTLRNIERVWKAEQKHEVERQKIEQLQKELAEERAREEIQTYAEVQGVVRKREERLDWMYQGPAAMVDREDYLLGRKVDKTLDLLEQQERGVEPKKEEYDSAVTMFSSQDLSGTATVDLANKIREDPLFNIMKKEKEQRKNLLSNPVKMKQLQQLLQESLGKKKSKKNKKQKKLSDSDSEERKHHKKHKKEKHYRPSSSDSNDERMAVKEKLLDSHKKSKKLEDKYERESSSSTYQNRQHNPPSFRDREYSSKHIYSSSESYCAHRNSSYEEYASKRSHKDSEIHSSSSRMERNLGKYSSSSYREKDYRNFSKSSYRENNSDSKQKRKLDTEEKERRLKEMEENAKWRDEQRERNFKRYKEEDEREDITNKIDASDFIKPMLAKAAEKGSLENRVKQKMFSIQRGNGVMDKHFARR